MSFYKGYVLLILLGISVCGQDASLLSENEKKKAEFLDRLPYEITNEFAVIYEFSQSDYAKLMFNLESVMMILPYGLVIDIQAFGKQFRESTFADMFEHGKDEGMKLFNRLLEHDCKKVDTLGVAIFQVLYEKVMSVLASATPEISAYLHQHPELEKMAAELIRALNEERELFELDY